jgi:hypothetical protein
MHALRVEGLLASQFEQGLQHIAADFGGAGPTGYPEMIAVTCNFDIEAALDLAQVFVKLTAEIRKAVVVGGFEDDIP